MTKSEANSADACSLRWEPDTGFLILVLDGVMTEEAAGAAVAEYQKRVSLGEAAFMLADYRKGTGISPAARKTFAEAKSRGDTYFSSFGASFAFRAVSNLAFKAVGLVMPITSTAFATEPEARAWLTEKRNGYLARRRSS